MLQCSLTYFSWLLGKKVRMLASAGSDRPAHVFGNVRLLQQTELLPGWWQYLAWCLKKPQIFFQFTNIFSAKLQTCGEGNWGQITYAQLEVV